MAVATCWQGRKGDMVEFVADITERRPDGGRVGGGDQAEEEEEVTAG